MASNIDPTVPAEGSAVVKQELRDNFQAAKDEIEALQAGGGSGPGDTLPVVETTPIVHKTNDENATFRFDLSQRNVNGQYRIICPNADVDLGNIGTGGGDMTIAVYDPQGISGDAFALALMTGQITEPQIETNALENRHYSGSSVSGGKMVASTVTDRELASDAVTTPKIAPKAVTTAEMADGTALQLVGYDDQGVARGVEVGSGLLNTGSVLSATGGTGGGLTTEDATGSLYVPRTSFYGKLQDGTATAIVFSTAGVALDGQGRLKSEGAGTYQAMTGSASLTINGSSPWAAPVSVPDATWTFTVGANTQILSAGSNINPVPEAGSYFIVPSHPTVPGNAGIYIATGTPNTGSLPCTKISDIDPVAGDPITNPADTAGDAVDIQDAVRDANGNPLLLVTIASFFRDGSDIELQGGTNATKAFDGSDLVNVGAIQGARAATPGTVSGTLTAANSNAVVRTSGNVTIPSLEGFNVVLRAGGAHTVTFNGNTSTAMAAGDVMTILVENGECDAVLTAAADKVAFT